MRPNLQKRFSLSAPLQKVENENRISEKAIGRRFEIVKKEANEYVVMVPNDLLTNVFEIEENKILGLAYSCVYLKKKNFLFETEL